MLLNLASLCMYSEFHFSKKIFCKAHFLKKKSQNNKKQPPNKKQASFDHTLVVYKKKGYKTVLEQVHMMEPQRYLNSKFISNYIISSNNTVGTDLPGNDIPIVTP